MLRLLLIFSLLGILYTACHKEHWAPVTETSEKQVPSLVSSEDDLSQNAVCLLPVEEMPYLLVCSHLENKWERKQCSERELKKFIAKNIRYPPDGDGYRGMVVVSFIIKKDGHRSDVKIRKGGPPSVNTEAMRIIDLLPPFHPGKFMGEIVKVEYNFPIRFPFE